MAEEGTDVEFQQITLKERNLEFYEASQACFAWYRKSRDHNVAVRGCENLSASAWQAKDKDEMDKRLREVITQSRTVAANPMLSDSQRAQLQGMILESEGWLVDPPNPEKFIEAIKVYVESSNIYYALQLIPSLIPFVPMDRQIHWAEYGNQLAESLPEDHRSIFYILFSDPLIAYVDLEKKVKFAEDLFKRVEALASSSTESHLKELAILKALNTTHQYGVERERGHELRQATLDGLERSLADIHSNLLRGIMLQILGLSYYRLAEREKIPDMRSALFQESRGFYLESVSTLERTRAYGELFNSYIRLGTTFLSIAELAQDFEKRNEFYRLGQEYLQKGRAIGEKTQLVQLRSNVAINLGVIIERMIWFEADLERRREQLQEAFELQLEGKQFAEQSQGYRMAGYASMNASEFCGLIADLEAKLSEKQKWASRQLGLSQEGVEFLKATKDWRGQIGAYTNAAFAYEKLAEVTSSLEEKQKLLQEMLKFGLQSIEFVEKVNDPLSTAYAYYKTAYAYQMLGVIEGDVEKLVQAVKYYELAKVDYEKTGEKHKHGEINTVLADALLIRSAFDTKLIGGQREEILQRSLSIHRETSNLYNELFLFHKAGENLWKIGQIHLVKGEYTKAQEVFGEVKDAFDRITRMVPGLADAYSLFIKFSNAYAKIPEGLARFAAGSYSETEKTFSMVASELAKETESSLRQLRQLLEAANTVCQFVTTGSAGQVEKAKQQLTRLQSALKPDAYSERLPYSIHDSIRKLVSFLEDPSQNFPPPLINLPLQEKMLAIAQTGHLVRTAMSLYQAASQHQETAVAAPTEETIRSYVARISQMVATRA